MLSNVQIITDDSGSKWALAIGYSDDGSVLSAHESHPNFKAITEKWVAGDAEGFAQLFDIPKAITAGFSRLSEQVTVKDGTVYFDGDPVHGEVESAILSLLQAGEDFAPLVNFYEKLTTNPLGDVSAGVYSWMAGQTQEGNFTLTPDGNILGYKSTQSMKPEWREGFDTVYVPSRRGQGIVNGREVAKSEYIEQVVGDTVEMPRSKVLHDLSRACGDGLHIGTYQYAKSFAGDTILLVEFNPRDIVSYPDHHSDWKLRVCRYKVVDVVDEPVDAPVYRTAVKPDDAEDDLDVTTEHEPLRDGDRIIDRDGDEGVIFTDSDGDLRVKYDDPEAAGVPDYLVEDDDWADDENAEDDVFFIRTSSVSGKSGSRAHGKGGKHSVAAEGRGLNPAQDPKTGQFLAGRPGSARNASTGRFAPRP